MNKKTQLGLVVILILALATLTSPPFLGNDTNAVTLEQRNFTLPNTQGEEVTLTDYRDKVVILDFMSVNCGNCQEEIGELKEIKQTYGNEVVILSIAVTTQQQLINFKQTHNAGWQFLIDDGTVMGENLEQGELLPKIMIFEENKLFFQNNGLTGYEKLNQEIQNALNN